MIKNGPRKRNRLPPDEQPRCPECKEKMWSIGNGRQRIVIYYKCYACHKITKKPLSEHRDDLSEQ